MDIVWNNVSISGMSPHGHFHRNLKGSKNTYVIHTIPRLNRQVPIYCMRDILNSCFYQCLDIIILFFIIF